MSAEVCQAKCTDDTGCKFYQWTTNDLRCQLCAVDEDNSGNHHWILSEKVSFESCAISCQKEATETTYCFGKGTCDASSVGSGLPNDANAPCTCIENNYYHGSRCQVRWLLVGSVAPRHHGLTTVPPPIA